MSRLLWTHCWTQPRKNRVAQPDFLPCSIASLGPPWLTGGVGSENQRAVISSHRSNLSRLVPKIPRLGPKNLGVAA
jgi:hypothetical protein